MLINMKKIIYIIILAALLSFTAFASYFYGKSTTMSYASAESTDGKLDLTKIKLLTEVQDIINKKFISWKSTSTPPTIKEQEYAIIKGFVSSYNDPYTMFFPPVEAKTFEESVKGSFGGVGMEVGSREGAITIISPIKDSPAQKIGIKSGDIVMRIDDKDTNDMSVEEAVSLIRGDIDTEVKLTVYRKIENKTLEFKIKRAEIKIPTIDTEIKKGVFVIHLYNFSSDSASQFQDALKKYIESNLTYLIIDLRGNPGGYLESAVNIASFFLPEGMTVVSEKGNKQLGEAVHRSKGFASWQPHIKIAVLVDEGSASASEILAGALKDHKIAKVYGQKSFGKGSVQELVNLSDGSSIKVTVATWYTPNGTSITQSKIVPDVEIPRNATSTYATELDTVINLMLKSK